MREMMDQLEALMKSKLSEILPLMVERFVRISIT